jgi:hypothetical protein
MTRVQRRVHARIWSVLGAVILLGLIGAVALRPPPTPTAQRAQP